MIKSTGTSVSISTDGGRTFTSIACDQIILSPQDTGEMGTLSEFSREAMVARGVPRPLMLGRAKVRR
ncbi:hypothetical protein DEIGR_100826 [Deinococcus grandis]|uniref:Uncharacterized protein n=1 Tax=Deinococcus grandis TaxID=57498 RepID=A0A100HHF1_9DEIO|nr:hypothetical protein [Deinococcus grandis]BBN95715.1 hypothetical protein DEGR_24480 [Deinococcus grandis]GAQ20799.1 hypothetical protein DEIGR_100826 [Deinococcus grandis]